MKNDVALNVVKDLVAEMALAGTMPASDITEAASLRKDLGINSLNLLILLVRLQEQTGVEFAAQDASVSALQTVGDLVRVLANER